MATENIKLEFTKLEMSALLSIIESIEATIGTSDNEDLGGTDSGDDFDTDMRRSIKKFDKMLKRNGYKR